MTRPYEDQLPEGATVVAWNEDVVVWKPLRPTWDGFPFVVHPVKNGRVAGSGTYDRSASEVTTITGIPL